ncbi:hypothetical protein RRG08_067347 [Elysia crispata]|uniref:Uncharacterized protein n=1 Tax=Elysia crispata TaxID=231223 RepID=A0AAE1BCV5_9GAST|nr:hypothetical protein RRG08_067347 [Elysia crispata]
MWKKAMQSAAMTAKEADGYKVEKKESVDLMAKMRKTVIKLNWIPLTGIASCIADMTLIFKSLVFTRGIQLDNNKNLRLGALMLRYYIFWAGEELEPLKKSLRMLCRKF